MGPVGQHRHQYHHRPDQPAGLLQLRDPHRRSTGSNPAVQGGEGSRGSDRLTAALSNLVASYGLLGVFVLMVGESCGLPLPSEVIMPTAGLLAATGHMQGGLIAAIVAGALANLVGSLIAYVLAARFGEPLLLGPRRSPSSAPCRGAPRLPSSVICSGATTTASAVRSRRARSGSRS